MEKNKKLSYRKAKESDLPQLIKMLADDQLGASREDSSAPPNSAYIKAFKNINSDPNNKLIVVEINNMIIGMLQITYIPYLSHKGAWRCLIEAVRIHKNYRSQGFGSEVFKWAIEQAKNKKCHIVQLTSNKERSSAIRFYKALGFSATHEGFKLVLNAEN